MTLNNAIFNQKKHVKEAAVSKKVTALRGCAAYDAIKSSVLHHITTETAEADQPAVSNTVV